MAQHTPLQGQGHGQGGDGSVWVTFPEGHDEFTHSYLNKSLQEAAVGALRWATAALERDPTQQPLLELGDQDLVWGSAAPVITGLRAFPAAQMGKTEQESRANALKVARSVAKQGLPLRVMMWLTEDEVRERAAATAAAAAAAGGSTRTRDRTHLAGAANDYTTSPMKPPAQVRRTSPLQNHAFQVRRGAPRCADVGGRARVDNSAWSRPQIAGRPGYKVFAMLCMPGALQRAMHHSPCPMAPTNTRGGGGGGGRGG